MGATASEATRHFSKKDFVRPGRIEHATPPEGTKGAVEKMLSKLDARPRLDHDTRKLELPVGHT